MALKYGPKGFLDDQEAGELVDLVYSKLGLNLRGFISDQNAKDRMRFMSVESACREAREKIGITLKQAAEQMKVQQYLLKSIEGTPGGERTRETLVKYVDFLGIRKWFDTWLEVNRDVYGRLKTEIPVKAIKKRASRRVLSTRKMKTDKDFMLCPFDDGDELYANGVFEFNITKMIQYIQENPGEFAIEEVMVDVFFQGLSSIKASHVGLVDISRPVILAEISSGRYNLIDGNHRMEKAHRIGVQKIPAYRLKAEQHIKFLMNKKAYEAYIEYWNDKLDDN